MPQARATSSYQGIQSVSRALSILELFSDKRPSLSVSQVADLTGLTRATCYRFCVTLRQRGYLEELGDRRFRLQGTVVPGTVVADDAAVRFDVEYACVSVPVRHEGSRPPLFKEGMPVVVVGAFVDGTDRDFASDQIIVSHTNEYKEDEAERLAEAEREACPS